MVIIKKVVKYIIFILLVVFASCENREWDNPFDPDCPKELFTPANFTAKQEGALAKLTWTQSNPQISGFVIERSIDGGATWSSAATPSKSELTWSDSNITGGKEHKYRLIAKADNNRSNEVTAQVTPVFAATINTLAVSNPTANSATSGGNITSDGGASVTTRGVCWNTSQNPTTTNLKTTDGSGTGSFTSLITGLTSGSIYYVRAYATNQTGTVYGNENRFIASSNQIIDADNNVYNTVNIGTQTWMVENLKTTKFRNGEDIPYYSKTSSRGYCWYNDDAGYKNTYGAIYNYYTTADSRSICPPGWHIPSDDEWTTLINYLGGESVAGGKLKEAGTTHWTSPNTGATNLTGFTALPGGTRDCGNNYGQMGTGCSFWSSKPVSGGWVYGFGLNYSNTKATMGSGFDCNSSYVRCIKD